VARGPEHVRTAPVASKEQRARGRAAERRHMTAEGVHEVVVRRLGVPDLQLHPLAQRVETPAT
jgi:hypothetical protein